MFLDFKMKMVGLYDTLFSARKKRLKRELAFFMTGDNLKRIVHVANLGFKKFKIKEVNNEIVHFQNNIFTIPVKAIHPWAFKEVLIEEVYKFQKNIDKKKKYTVFDIGANHGYASLYFASKKWCKNVYSFEIIPQNAQFASEVIKKNKKWLQDKINFNACGLGANNCEIEANYFEHRSAISSISQDFINSYAPEENGRETKVKCVIKKASETIKKIVEENNIENIILKIDVEGAEYEIFDDLIENYPEFFDKVEKIIGEAHLGFDKLYEQLIKAKKWKGVCFPISKGLYNFELYIKK